MKRTTWLGFFLLMVLIVALALWQPAVPALTLPLAPPGQEQRAVHLELATLYEQNRLLTQAREEYIRVLSGADDELSVAAWTGLQRVLAQQRDPWFQARDVAQRFLVGFLQIAMQAALVIPFALIVWWLVGRVGYRSGYVLLPFEDLTGAKNSEALSQIISTTIQQARLVHQSASAGAILVPGSNLPGLAGSTVSDPIPLPSFDLLTTDADALPKSFPMIDAVNLGGTSISLGQLVAAAQQWLDTRRYRIGGNLVRIGNALRVTATLRDARTRSVVRVWQVSTSCEGESNGTITQLGDTLAYQMLFDLSTGLQAPTWRGLAEFTKGLEQLRAFSGSGDELALLQEARTHLEAAVAQPGHYAPAQFYLGLLYNLLGQGRQAAVIFSALKQSAPGLKLEATYNLGVAYYQQFKDWAHERAEREFNAVLDQSSTDEKQDAVGQLRALAHCGLAAIYAHRCRRTGASAEENLRETEQQAAAALPMISSPSIQALAVCAIGIAYRGNGKLDEAIEKFQEALRLQPGQTATLVNLGATYLDKNQTQLALEALQRAVQLSPHDEYAQYKLGQAWRFLGEMEEAIRAFQRAPHIADAHNDRGELLATEQQYDEAIAEFRAALDLNKKIAPAHANLAWWLIESGHTDEVSLREALEHARQAVALARGSPHEWRARDILGRVCIAGALWDAGCKELRQSIQLNPSAIQNRYHLAQVYQATSEIPLAREQLSQALQVKEGGLWRERAEGLLKELSESRTVAR